MGFGREEVLSGMAAVSFMRAHSWVEIKAFADSTGHIRESWEIEALMDMSRAYCSEISLSSDALRIPPMERALAENAKKGDIAGEPVT